MFVSCWAVANVYRPISAATIKVGMTGRICRRQVADTPNFKVCRSQSRFSMSAIAKKNSSSTPVVNEDGSWVKRGSWKIRPINNILPNMPPHSVMTNLVSWRISSDPSSYSRY